jgi:hypothetical protein
MAMIRCSAALFAMAAITASAAPRLFFVANRGAADNEVQYFGHTPQMGAYWKAAEVTLAFPGAKVDMRFVGANAHSTIQAAHQLEGRVHLLLGNDPAAWREDLPAFERLVYRNLYSGIDLSFDSSGRQLKSEFVVAPGSDPAVIRIEFSGVKQLEIDPNGALLCNTDTGTLREDAAYAYQRIGGRYVAVEAALRLLSPTEAVIQIGPYDRSQPLMIAGGISWGTYLGGAGLDAATAVAVDASGNAIMAGWTDSINLPTANALYTRKAGGTNAFVGKFAADGRLLYCTYLGGNGEDRAFAVTVDSTGAAYLTGATTSTNFPVVGGVQRSLQGKRNAFIVKLNPSGNALVFSTYFGGSVYDNGNGIAVDNAGNVYVSGDTTSPDLPFPSGGYQTRHGGLSDAFVVKLLPSGAALAYGTYLGGTADDRARAIAVDSSGNAYITGDTYSANFPVMNAVQPVSGGNQDAFVAKLNSRGTILVYSTYLGGSGGTVGLPESGAAIALDALGNAYVAGTTSSSNFPLVNAAQAARAGTSTDAFVAKLGVGGNSLVYSTYLGGSGGDYGTAIAVDAMGSAYVAGYTASSDFPTIHAVQSSNAGSYDAFLAQLTPDGSSLSLSTYLGGSANDAAYAVALSGDSVYIAGQTASMTFPVYNGAQMAMAGIYDAFLVRLPISSGPHNYIGFFDGQDCSGGGGWAVDLAQPNTTVQLDVYDGTGYLFTIAANQYRPDVHAAGYGNGYNGFRYTLPDSLKDGVQHVIHIKYARTDTELINSPRSISCPGKMGVVDAINCSTLVGWAWDVSRPNSSVLLNVYDGANLLATTPANVWRPDVYAAGYGTGYYGFSLRPPLQLKDGFKHTVAVRFSDTNTDLGRSPQPIQCLPLLGFDDGGTCQTIGGWAWDPNQPGVPVTVDIYDGATLIGSVVADQYRWDVYGAGYGTGYYGYTMAVPPQLKDNRPHTVNTRYSGTSIGLINSGRTITCGGL